MKENIIKDIVEWDVVNWKKAIDYWSKNSDLKSKVLQCLELGSNRGGLSLWLALNGHSVICSDLASPEKPASALHEKYNVQNMIHYESIDATQIPYKSAFDVIVFKSILGGLSRNNKTEFKKKAIDSIYTSLKPGGLLLFAENIEGSAMHKYFRKKFVSWGKDWNYLKISELNELFSNYKNFRYITVGFFGAFGRNEKQRAFLGKLDNILSRVTSKTKRYILIGIAEK